jgi:pimeloyl-ACP methyl ester carboxylesterase
MVYIVDQRDHGKSPHTNEFDYFHLAEDLLGFMEANWLFSAHIIGHSMGGKTAMQFAALHPEMVNKLIVLDITPKKYKSGHDAIFEALLQMDLKKLSNRNDAEEFLIEKIMDDSTRAFLLKSLKRNKDGSFKWKMNLPLLYDNYEAIINDLVIDEPIDIPSLFVSGSRSDYIREEDKILIHSKFSNVVFETIQDAGHWLHADKPKVLKHIVKDFIT